MKKFIFMMLLIAGMVQNVNANNKPNETFHSPSESLYQTTNASITIKNRSEYTLTVKILKTGGRGLYRIVYVSPNSSSVVSFSSSDSFFTKTKATKSGFIGSETLYRKGGTFSVQCDNLGYTEGTLEFYVSSGSGSSGQSISKSEFENDR